MIPPHPSPVDLLEPPPPYQSMFSIRRPVINQMPHLLRGPLSPRSLLIIYTLITFFINYGLETIGIDFFGARAIEIFLAAAWILGGFVLIAAISKQESYVNTMFVVTSVIFTTISIALLVAFVSFLVTISIFNSSKEAQFVAKKCIEFGFCSMMFCVEIALQRLLIVEMLRDIYYKNEQIHWIRENIEAMEQDIRF